MPSKNARHNVLTIRLSDDEMEALGQFQGERNIDKVRAAIHSNSIANAIAQPMTRELSRMAERIEKLETKLDTHDRNQGDELRALRSRMDNEPIVLPAKPENVLKNLDKVMPRLLNTLGDIQDYLRGRKTAQKSNG